MPGPDDNFKLDPAAAQEAFGRLNAELFGGQLERIPIRLSNAVRKGGSYTAKMSYEQPNAFMRRMLREYRIKDVHDQAITLSRRVILTQEVLDRVMVHELIHQWQAEVLGISEDNGGHGETFLSKMAEINAVKGADFVTVTSDVVAGGTGGKAGQTYHVAIFEGGGRMFGGFSRRPFTESILAILEQTSKRRGMPYRTVVTTSHDAQTLTNMSRMRLNSRSRSWTRIPDDIYDAIVSGEVVTAALRRAAAEVIASSGTVIVYHATLSGSDILDGGFRKSDEVERVGLGGSSTGGSVSFTTDWGVAKGIHRSFEMMHSLVNSADPLAAIRGHFESLDGQLRESVLSFWKSGDGRDLQELLDGWKPKPYGTRMQTYDQLVQQGFKPVHAAGDEGGEGDTLYYQWLEPVTDEDADGMVYTYVKVYFYANDEEYNPVFMGGDASHFKGIPRDDIGIFTVELHIDPSRKHPHHGEIHTTPGYAILPAESEYRVSDMSMIGKVLDYDTQPGDEPKVQTDEVSFHSDADTEEAVNRLLSLLQRHRGIIERGGEVDVRQAMALLRNADDMWDVMGLAAKILAATKLKHARRALEQAIDLWQRSQPSDDGSKAIAALPPPVRREVEQAAHSERFADISERWYDRDEPAYVAWVDRLGDLGMSESAAESEIDDWISSKQWDYAGRYAEEMKWVSVDVPGFKEGDAVEFLELAIGLEEATQQSAAAASPRAARARIREATQDRLPPTLYHATPPGSVRDILRRGLVPQDESYAAGPDGAHPDRVFLSRFDDPRYMNLPAGKMEGAAVLAIDTSHLDRSRLYPDDTVYGAYFNDNLEDYELGAVFPDHYRRWGSSGSVTGFGDWMDGNGPSDSEVEGILAGRFGLTLWNSGGMDAPFELGEVGYEGRIPPEAVSLHAPAPALRSAAREPAFLKKLRDADALPSPVDASAALSSVMGGTLVHHAAGSTGTPGEDLSGRMQSILDNGLDPAYWAKPWEGSPGVGHPQAVYLSLAWPAVLDDPPPNYVLVEPRLMRPLVMRAGDADGNYTWGPALNEATGKSGKGLSSFLRAKGYDSVITVNRYGVGEVAYFGEEPLPAFLPELDRTARTLGHAAEAVGRAAAVEDIYRGVKTVVEKYGGQGLFARFSDVPKIGIRPSTEHHDPYGVYFYPVDWLAENADFGTTYVNLPYITVARIRRSGWLNLATIRPARARELAEKGGVLEEYEARTEGKGLNQAKGGRAGKRLWDAVEAKVKPFESEANKMEWNRIFGRMGVKAVYDPGTGSVNSAEPSQIVVLDLSLIEVVDVVDNKEDRKSVFHAVLKAVADEVLDDGWRVSGSHAEGGITADGTVGGQPVAMSVLPAKAGFEMEVTLSYHNPAGRKRRIVSRGRMPNEWEGAPAAYLSEGHARSISRSLEEADIGARGEDDAEDMLDAALRALTKLRLSDLTVEEVEGGAEFWKNTGDGKIEGSLKVLPDGRMELELYAEDWLLFGGEDSVVIEIGPMRVSWEGDPSSASADMASELSRAVRELRVTDDGGKDKEKIDRDAAAEIVRMRTLSWMFPDDILTAAGQKYERKKTAGACPHGDYRSYSCSPGGVLMPPRVTPDIRDAVSELFGGACICLRCRTEGVRAASSVEDRCWAHAAEALAASGFPDMDGMCLEASVVLCERLRDEGVDAGLVRRWSDDHGGHWTVRTPAGEFDPTIAWRGDSAPEGAERGRLYEVGDGSPHAGWEEDTAVDEAAAYRIATEELGVDDLEDLYDSALETSLARGARRVAMPYLHEPKCPSCGHMGPQDPKVESWASLPDGYRELLRLHYGTDDRQEIARRLMWDRTVPTYCGECGRTYLFEKPSSGAPAERVAGRFKAWHGTSDALLDGIREAGGLADPCLAATPALAEYYAEAAAEEDGGEPVVLEIDIRDRSKLRYDGNAMDEPVTVGVSEDDRNTEWGRAEQEHPEWARGSSISIPPEEWEYSWRGAHSVRYEGLLPLADIGGDINIQASLPATTFSGLPEAVRIDIMENLHDAFFAGTNVSHEILRGVLDDMDTQLPTARLSVTELAAQSGMTHAASDIAVVNLTETLRRVGELDPILTNAGRFHDGGHRLSAYEADGRDTVPTVDIAPLLAADWEAEFNEEIPGLRRAVAGHPRFVTMDELRRMAATRYWHGTTAGAMRSIEGDGYIHAPVHLTDSPAAAKEFAEMAADDARDRPLVLEVVLPPDRIGRLRVDPDFDAAPGNFISDEDVPLEWIPWYPDPEDPDPTGPKIAARSAATAWYYHGSAPDDILDIAQWGLLARDDRDGVSVTADEGKARSWAGLKSGGRDIEVFRIPASALPDLVPEDAAPAEPDVDFTAGRQIPPERLEIMRDGSWTPLLDVYGEFLDPVTASVEAWHGTDADFAEFDPAFAHGQLGFHFGTEGQAGDVLGEETAPRRLIRVELDISNPLRMPDLGGWQGHSAKAEFERALGAGIPGSGSHAEIAGAVTGAGYDSVVYANRFEGEGDSYIVFDASRIRIVGDTVAASLSRAADAVSGTRAYRAEGSGRGAMADAMPGGTYFFPRRETAELWAGDRGTVVERTLDLSRASVQDVPEGEMDRLDGATGGEHGAIVRRDPDGSGEVLEIVVFDGSLISASLSRAARALGEHLGDTVTAYRALAAEQAEKVMREGFTGPHHAHGVFYTASEQRAAFYARFMASSRLQGVVFELEADTSRSLADMNDTTEWQSDELMEEVWSAASDMMRALEGNAPDADVDGLTLERWLGGRTVSEGYYEDVPEQHSVWQLVADETEGTDGEMTVAEAREALPPGRYGGATVLDSRGVAGIDIGESEGQAVSRSGVPADRLKAIWIPSDLLRQAGVEPPAGAETMRDFVDVIPAKFDADSDARFVAEIERQRDEARAARGSDPPDGMDPAGADAHYDGLEEVADAMDSILGRWRDEGDSGMPGHIYSKLVRGERVTPEDLDREGTLVRYPLPEGRLAATKVLRRAIARSERGQARRPEAVAASAEGRAARRAAGEACVSDDMARALRRAAEDIGWSEDGDVDPESFVDDEGFVEDESGHAFWGSRGSGCLFVRNHPEDGPQLLLVKRSPQVEEPSTWGTTGGAVPKGESNLFASAVRETREEIGSIPPYEAVRKYVWQAPGGTFTYTTFILECTDMDWLPAAFNWEATDARWASLEEAASYDLHFGLVSILKDMGESLFPATGGVDE